MSRIYLDNAATSWPKPEAVYEAVLRAMRELGAPAGRSAYAEAAEVERVVVETRRHLASLLGTSDSKRIVFTSNATDSLNLAIHGTLGEQDHVVTSAAEHNSVLRPLRELETSRQVEVTVVGCDSSGVVDPGEVAEALRPNTRLIALTHASNVTGAVQPLQEVGSIAADRGLLFLVDAAQTLGHWPVDVDELNCSLLAAPGHKGLLGPLGLGLLYVAPGVEESLKSHRQGGTGTSSESDRQPSSLPDKYESGNLNVPAIFGLRAGLDYLQRIGASQIRQEQHALTAMLLSGLGDVAGVTVHGPAEAERQVGVVSISVAGYDPQEVASMLDSSFRIQVRSGLHCAPRMHAALGTKARGGTIRFSLGPFNSREQVEASIAAVSELATSV